MFNFLTDYVVKLQVHSVPIGQIKAFIFIDIIKNRHSNIMSL